MLLTADSTLSLGTLRDMNNLCIRVYHKNTFFKNKLCPTHQASAWGLVWRNPKGFLISTKFRGSSSHFRFDHFYNIDFHSALTFLDWDLRSKGWVKIYNVNMVKTKMARVPPKLCRNQKSFQMSPQADAWWVPPILFLKKLNFWTPYWISWIDRHEQIFSEKWGSWCPTVPVQSSRTLFLAPWSVPLQSQFQRQLREGCNQKIP